MLPKKVEDDGVFVVPKPLSRVLFMQALRMTRAARSRLTGLQSENRRLQKRIEDIRQVDRAKCLLIECCGMTEPEAHSYIEQQAMNQRRSKRGYRRGHHRWKNAVICAIPLKNISYLTPENFFGFFDFIEKFPTDYDILNGV